MVDHGVSPRTHGNHKRTPANTFSLDTYQLAMRFLEAYLDKHAIKVSLNNGTCIQCFTLIEPKIVHFFDCIQCIVHSLEPIFQDNKKGPKSDVLHLPKSISKKTIHEAYLNYSTTNEPGK